MNKIIIAIGMASLLGLAIPCSAQYASDSCGCPAPLGGNGPGWTIPEFHDQAQAISSDGKWLTYDNAYLLNLATLERTHIVVHGGLPNEVDVGLSDLTWCPYDPDLLALNVDSYIDTSGNGNSTEVENIFTYRVSTGESQIITPGGPDHNGRIIGAWLPGSKLGMDSILIQYGGSAYIYIPETQNLIFWGKLPGLPGTVDTVLYSPNGKHILSWWRDTNIARDTFIYYLDGKVIQTPRGVGTMENASFSPDSKLVALDVKPIVLPSDGSMVYEQVWVFSADSSAPTSVKIINFQCLYCTYNFLGAYAVFLTDSTLAVSMHKDGADTSALYEITIDGRMVRQLTYVPANNLGVESATTPANSISLTSYPNPFSQSSTITFSCAESGVGEVTIVNLLGAEVARIFSGGLSAGQHSFEWDASGVPAGMYECVVRAGGEVQRIPILHY